MSGRGRGRRDRAGRFDSFLSHTRIVVGQTARRRRGPRRVCGNGIHRSPRRCGRHRVRGAQARSRLSQPRRSLHAAGVVPPAPRSEAIPPRAAAPLHPAPRRVRGRRGDQALLQTAFPYGANVCVAIDWVVPPHPVGALRPRVPPRSPKRERPCTTPPRPPGRVLPRRQLRRRRLLDDPSLAFAACNGSLLSHSVRRPRLIYAH